MKNLWILLAWALTIQVHAQKFKVDTLALNAAYREIVDSPNTLERQKAYLNAFPKNWTEYINLYGYSSEKDYDLTMYHLASKQMHVLNHRLTLVKNPVICNRLIDLSINAEYSPDAPAYLQRELHKRMNLDMEVVMEELSKRTPEEIASFWTFYWASQTPSKKFNTEANRLEKIFINAYPQTASTMKTCLCESLRRK